MNKNQSLMMASVIFGIAAIIHLLRSILNWPASIGNFNVPVYFSYFGVVVAGYLSFHMYSAGRK